MQYLVIKIYACYIVLENFVISVIIEIKKVFRNKKNLLLLGVAILILMVGFGIFYISRYKSGDIGELPLTGGFLFHRENIQVSKTVSEDVIEPGDELTYVIEIVNNDPETVLIEYVIDYVPDYFVVDVGTINNNGSYEVDQIIWNNDGSGYSLSPNNSMEFIYSGQVADTLPYSPYDLENNVEININDGYMYNTSEISSVIAYPDIQVEKVAESVNPIIYPGETITYTLLLENTGRIPATEVEVTDNFSEYLTVTDPGGGTVSGQIITWNFNSIDTGEEITIQYEVLVEELPGDGEVEILNTVQVTSREEEENGENNSSTSSLPAQNTDELGTGSIDDDTETEDDNTEGNYINTDTSLIRTGEGLLILKMLFGFALIVVSIVLSRHFTLTN